MNERRLAMADPAFTLGVTNQGVRPGRSRLLPARPGPPIWIRAAGRESERGRSTDLLRTSQRRRRGRVRIVAASNTQPRIHRKAASASRRVDLGE